MIRTILIWIFFLMVLGLVVLWLVAGGWSATVRTAQTLANPVDFVLNRTAAGEPLISLPWQPAELTRGPDISEYAAQADARLAALGEDSGSENYEQQSVRAQNFGTPSPYVGMVIFSDHNATSDNALSEYVTIAASQRNASPISLTGWSLQSAVSGLRAYLPAGGAELFVSGSLNQAVAIYLDPGASAIISTGVSPLGASVRENMCTGYLAQTQVFVPPLDNTCPSPREMLPATAENLRTLGSSCFDYVQRVPRCYFTASPPSDLTAACRSYIVNNLSYNGCVAMYRTRPSFFGDWRLFLGMHAELWYNTRDVIRLLDAEGRTVDVVQY